MKVRLLNIRKIEELGSVRKMTLKKLSWAKTYDISISD